MIPRGEPQPTRHRPAADERLEARQLWPHGQTVTDWRAKWSKDCASLHSAPVQETWYKSSRGRMMKCDSLDDDQG